MPVEVRARLFGCIPTKGNPGGAALRERYASQLGAWHVAALPNGGFIAVPEPASLFEDSDGITAVAGWDSGKQFHLAASEFGPRFSARVNGRFCAAHYDVRTSSLWLAVDTFGIERLFWCERHGVLCFSDDVAAIWSWFGEQRRLCPESVDAYFTLFHIPAPLTGFGNIRQVPPNAVITVTEGIIQVHEAVWKPVSGRGADLTENLLELESALCAEVETYLAAGEQAALLFSGGVDSMLLAALLRRRGIEIEAQTLGEAGSEELRIAAKRAWWVKMSHRSWPMRFTDLQELDCMRKWRMPVFSMRVAYVDWLCGLVSRNYRCLISGSGADGVFLGDPIWQGLSRGTAGSLAAPGLYRGAKRFARRYLYGEELRKSLRGRSPQAVLVRAYEQQGRVFQYLVAARPSVIDAYARATSSACATVFPFLSRRVVELALEMEDPVPKGALKKALARLVPAFPVTEGKRGFGHSVSLAAPFATGAGVRAWGEEIASGALCRDRILDARGVRLLFEACTSLSPGLRQWAWAVRSLDAWYRLFIAS